MILVKKNDFHRYAVQSEIGKKTVKYRGSNNNNDRLTAFDPGQPG